MRVGSSVFVPQFEGEGHGDELGVAVPHQLRAGRVARAPAPPAEAPDQTDGVAEARGWRQRARAGEGALVHGATRQGWSKGSDDAVMS